MNCIKKYLNFTFHLMISHFITYFVVGVVFFFIGLNSSGYYEKHPIVLVTALHRDSNSIWVMAGPLFQILRALLFSCALFPIRDVFLERRNGWLYLWLIFIVFAIFAPAGEAPGSIEGIVYTKLPPLFHLLYFPELILQTLLFSLLFLKWEKGKIKKPITIPLSIGSGLIIASLIFGLVQKLS